MEETELIIVLSSLSPYPNPPTPMFQLSSLKFGWFQFSGGEVFPKKYFQLFSGRITDSQWEGVLKSSFPDAHTILISFGRIDKFGNLHLFKLPGLSLK